MQKTFEKISAFTIRNKNAKEFRIDPSNTIDNNLN
jgi:hypothetical protein